MNLVYLLLVIPLAAAVILVALPWHRVSALLNMLASLATLGVAILLLHDRPAPDSLVFIDDLNISLVVLTSLVGFTTSWFSATYVAHEVEIGRLTPVSLRFYHAMYQFLSFAMILALCANNIGVMWVAIEAATLTTVVMVSIYAAGQSSYSGLVVLLAAIIVTVAGAVGVHRLASDRVRRAPPWDCGFPDPRPAVQYTASSFAQPLRRVFGTMIFRVAERVDMPEPGEIRPARFDVRLIDPVWTGLYAPIIAFVGWIADRANPLQYLTIRRYLSLMFAALIVLLSAVALSR